MEVSEEDLRVLLSFCSKDSEVYSRLASRLSPQQDGIISSSFFF